ncbi:hypothetical protein BIY21_03715 [Vibrio ponticus]|uniref:Acid phosphatase n=1 Tax=Vibrio ponticus TaxID=265668 RepID=A0ABX3F7H6_9VIBR|nr:hypothetical protein [Vibrio ponticus]OLQ86546.1 hypothetical protein BIY21_03715 [Vibrio ponticus]
MNKKLSFLAASMAIALAGCGGGSGSDNDGSQPEGKGIVITGFDGYFKNAVVFEDFDNNGILGDGEKIFGLTNAQGKLTLPADTKVEGSIALQTFKPGGISEPLAKRIAAATPEIDTPAQIQNIFTTDMDHPNQPMANSVVFRAPAEGLGTNAVISPITDLVSIELEKVGSLATAKENVSNNLGANEADLFSDFVQDAKTNLASAQLHKTAQILTETKAKGVDAYEDNASEIASIAKDTSEKLVTEQNMASEELLDVKPVINPSKPSDEVKTNFKLLVVAEQQSRVANEINAIALTQGATSNEISLVGLFEDKFSIDGSYNDVDASKVEINHIGNDVSISFNQATQSFTVTSHSQFKRDLYIIKVTTYDGIAATGTEEDTAVSVTFEMKVELPNEAPQLNAEYQSTLQTGISEWMLIQGKAFTAQLDMWDLFTDREGDVLDYIADIKTVIPGLTSSYDATTGVMTISGRPAEAHSAGKTFNIVAEDNVPARIKSEPATFTLPVIHQGDITVDTEAKDQLQKAVNQWQLKVLEPFNQTLNISSLFSGDESGEVEYYANYAAHDNTDPANPIPGVDIEINHTTGDVTLSGTPTSKTNGVVLYLAKGINYTGGADNDVESEMVKIVLPNVQAADLGSIDINHAAKSELQTTANGWANELQVGVRFEKTLDIRTLFVDEIAGKAEYYANYAANDHTTPANPIHGVKVSVNNETGVVTLVGTPTKVATDVKLYLAKGYDLIDDNDIDVESEMVVIDLPVVQPGEDITPPPAAELAFTEAHFNNKVAKMGSFARADGEIAYAMMRKNGETLEICWGDNDNGSYQSNIGNYGEDFNNPLSSDQIIPVLSRLDQATGYEDSETKDCWAAELRNGLLVSSEVYNGVTEESTWEMLYQNVIGSGEEAQYQIIMKLNDDELFWFDSTDTPFAQVNPVSSKVEVGTVEYQLMEDTHPAENNENKYSVNEYTYTSDTKYSLDWVLPGYIGEAHVNDWAIAHDKENREIIQLTDTDGDYPKTRTRYIHRDFGKFYINIEWDRGNYMGAQDGIQYMLFSTDKALMTELGKKLPIVPVED